MPQQEAERCRLIGGTYANVLQFVLGIAALTGLLVWIYDVSKQGYGALFVHFWNIVMSMILADLSRRANADAVERDACALYFVQFVLDMMLGMVMIWAMVRTQEWLAERCNVPSLAVSGDYGNPPKVQWFWHQLGAYMMSLLIIKTIISTVVVAEDRILSRLSTWLFSPVAKHPDVELTIVMIVCPWILNALQFWIMDNMVSMSNRQPNYGYLPNTGGETLTPTQPAHAELGPSGDALGGTFSRAGDARGDFKDLPREPSWMSSRPRSGLRAVVSAAEGLTFSPRNRGELEVLTPTGIYPTSHTLV
ncbi:vacuolar membrane protein-domain-containing protein [Tribonema minus]|uniref:Vacuolar membrane protein-domain-containing protein n=1 Tax=Tribonema minus TaxID=303371 RepID=A0A835YS54_9STRA|nr:vacuolar membrane protein-domain-containing protein [Tribonema minus]